MISLVSTCLALSHLEKMPSMRHAKKLSYFLLCFLALTSLSVLALAREKSRRAFISRAIPSLFLVGSLDVKPAKAVKDRKEALCSTGFFTNIGEFLFQRVEKKRFYLEPLVAHI